jgi:iron complex outermembrane receptor protein
MPKQNGGARAHGLSQLVAVALSLITLVAPVYADTATFSIDPQDLSGALKAFAVQSHREIFFAPELARGRRSKGVKGKYDDLRALNIILEGTGLDFSVTTSDAILVRDPTSKSESSPAVVAPTTSANKDTSDPPIRVTQAQVNPNIPADGSSVSSEFEKPKLEEIIVTAQKRAERLQDVPVPVTALSADSLVGANQLGLQSYYSSVPGLNFSMDNRGAPSMSIRGLTTGAYVTPTVGVTIDDVPFGSTVVVSSFSPAPDVDPNELTRVEVLRGPQGTLYGASSIGGLIKYVTIDPSTDAVGGRVQVGGETIRNGNGGGYNASGAINVPLDDTLAIRANGFTHQDPGYIDNVETGQKGVNETSVYGGRLSALWRPSELLTLKLSALLQHNKADGSSQVDIQPGLGDLQQSYLGGTGGYEREIQAYSANLAAKIGSVDLTSLTGYGRASSLDSYDVSSALGGATKLFYGVGGVAWAENNKSRKFSQEFRLAVPLGARVDWLFGVFYTNERTNPDGGYVLIDPATFERETQVYDQRTVRTYEEYAAFTDFTLRITDRLDVQFGGRESWNKQTQSEGISGTPPLFADSTEPETDSKDSSFTYLVTPRLKLSSSFMAYARFASGYRPGGPNTIGVLSTVPRSFAPDETQNYELGAKSDFLDQRLSLDASVYYIRWRDIQLGLIDSAFDSYTANGGRAKSSGVELSIQARPLTGMTASIWGVWNDAKLTEAVPAGSTAIGADGDRLPYSSRFSANFSLQQDFPLADNVTGFVGGTLSYVGDREGEFPSVFTASTQRQSYPGYARTDLHTGLKYDTWVVNFFVNNLADRRGLLAGGLGQIPPFAFNYIQPRTAGLNVTRNF